MTFWVRLDAMGRFFRYFLAATAAATLAASGPLAQESGAGSNSAPDPTTQKPDDAITEMAPMPPPLPPEASVMSLQCAVPPHEIATPAPLPATIARLQAGKKLRILAIGAASVQQFDRKNARGNDTSQFANLLGKVLKGVQIEVINRGVSGEVVATASQRLINEAAMIRPDMVLWQLGTSDAISRVPIEQFIETVRATVRRLRDNNIDVVLVGLQYTPQFARDEHYYSMRTALHELATAEQLVHVRRFHAMEFIARTKANIRVLPDGEFNAGELGHQCMAEHVAQALIASVFLRRTRKPPSKS